MRITKTRLMRGPTINPNPPICKSKEPSFTYLQIFSCADDHLITEIAHYNWNWTEAHAAAYGGTGTYTKGYFYEAAFKKTTDLAQNHCLGPSYFYGLYPDPEFAILEIYGWLYDSKLNRHTYMTFRTFDCYPCHISDPISISYSDLKWLTSNDLSLTLKLTTCQALQSDPAYFNNIWKTGKPPEPEPQFLSVTFFNPPPSP